ncbi:MAG TPA: hypothetical protein VEM33_00790 [Burkholderiales bacterium]|nr:hypothetical protein [Burkholderiales bacterium]
MPVDDTGTIQKSIDCRILGGPRRNLATLLPAIDGVGTEFTGNNQAWHGNRYDVGIHRLPAETEPMTLERTPGEYLRFPSPGEVLAIERAARRARAKAIGRLFAVAGRQLKEMIMKVPRTDPAPHEGSRFPTKRKTMTTSFWKDALASLPPSVQVRYAASFEAAEHFDALLDLGSEAWGSAKQGLAKICQASARAMRRTARILEGAAHRLLPTR